MIAWLRNKSPREVTWRKFSDECSRSRAFQRKTIEAKDKWIRRKADDYNLTDRILDFKGAPSKRRDAASQKSTSKRAKHTGKTTAKPELSSSLLVNEDEIDIGNSIRDFDGGLFDYEDIDAIIMSDTNTEESRAHKNGSEKTFHDNATNDEFAHEDTAHNDDPSQDGANQATANTDATHTDDAINDAARQDAINPTAADTDDAHQDAVNEHAANEYADKEDAVNDDAANKRDLPTRSPTRMPPTPSLAKSMAKNTMWNKP
ncbi:Aste57867_15508 [Aphanomyces stellatus]|uniref:Aste57867_15508 protein n=1 Tax=Aphanomyces stellatus TaxID=120398 RepID=A0A485L565_9STRA|nr:hypothetical protein As57867_015452 [Aphanomyces stellatus]VFT92310.1 Aste57867_15508 [Aphanomyces stellatus]